MRKHTLIVAEKPDVAKTIAYALDAEGKPRKMIEKGMPYYIANQDEVIVIVPALGHLYTVVEEKKNRLSYPTFSFKWVPIYMVKKGSGRIHGWLEVISKLAKQADTFIDACDYDIEGSIIGFNVLKYACAGKEMISRRMKYSTLTKEELRDSYVNSLPHLDFTLIEAGLARHEVDWLYGINLSRALTAAAKKWSGKYATLSTGRVQGPTLGFIAAREKAFKSFVPTLYWEIVAEIEASGQTFEATYERERVETKREASHILDACAGKKGKIEKVEAKSFQQSPPAPFNLGSLQSEAYNLFRYSPKHSSSIAQRLYLDALISYPRTSSQKLPLSIDYATILKNLSRNSQYRKLTKELLAKPVLRPIEGRNTDPAHPAIYPTGRLPTEPLDGHEKSLLDVIIRRFMVVFGRPAVKQSIKITIVIGEHRFHLKGTRILKEGWLHFCESYARSHEVLLPTVKEGQLVNINGIISNEKSTSPPPRYNPSSLLRKMEKEEVGTKATRADIIQTLYDRKYITDETMATTHLGFKILEVLGKHCPPVISTRLTRELERKMNNIQTDREKRDEILADTIQTLKPIMQTLKEKEREIGEQLGKALDKARTEERTIGTCPTCKTGRLVVLHSRTTGKRFLGCTNYFKGTCGASVPLPQTGNISPSGKTCTKCGWPIIQVRTNRRRSWILCCNIRCTLKDRGKRKNEMQNM